MVDLLKTQFQCLPGFWRLFVCVSLRNASSLGLIISKAMTTAWVTHKTPVNRSQQCFSPVACSILTHIFRFHSWPGHAGRVCLPYLSAKAVETDEKCDSFFCSNLLFLSLSCRWICSVRPSSNSSWKNANCWRARGSAEMVLKDIVCHNVRQKAS